MVLGLSAAPRFRSARLCEVAHGELAMAALDVEVGILGRDGESSGERFHSFLVFPDAELRLRELKNQSGIPGFGG